MYPVNQILVLNDQLICHIPEAAHIMEKIKEISNSPKMIHIEWNPGIENKQPVIQCSLNCGGIEVDFAFSQSSWNGLMEEYHEILFHWGDQLQQEDKSLALPWDHTSFYKFLKNWFQILKRETLPHMQQKALFQIIANFFDLDEEDVSLPVH